MGGHKDKGQKKNSIPKPPKPVSYTWSDRAKTESEGAVRTSSRARQARCSIRSIVFYSQKFISFIVLLQLSQFPPLALPSSGHPTPPVNPHPVVHVHGAFIRVPWLNPSSPSFPPYPLPSLLCSLSVCSLFPCLWFCFAHLFVLFIRFLLIAEII